jgi:hypothetical protein
MENLCYFVNSRGILKSCDFRSPNPKSSCNNDKKYLYDMLQKMFDGMTIYVCSDLLSFFVNDILPNINKTFVLVSGDSDLCVPKEALRMEQFNNLLHSNYLIRWLPQNTQIQNIPKIIQLPIGLDYHTVSNNPACNWQLKGEGHLPGQQELTLVRIRQNMKPFYERIPKIYVNFTKGNDRFGQRIGSLENIPSDLLEINESFTPRTINWQKISNYSFVLSPFGIGMDCHRTWEALCLGCIPVVKAVNFSKLFEDLPVLIVNDWNEVNRELLDTTIENYKTKTFNYKKLQLKFWVNKIKCLE